LIHAELHPASVQGFAQNWAKSLYQVEGLRPYHVQRVPAGHWLSEVHFRRQYELFTVGESPVSKQSYAVPLHG